MGYATLYGDHGRRHNVLRNVYRPRCSRSAAGATRILPEAALCEGPGDPRRIISKPPSPEAGAPTRRTSDSLPLSRFSNAS